jgi:hypothetical protein
MSRADEYELEMLRGDFRRLAQENAVLRGKVARVEALMGVYDASGHSQDRLIAAALRGALREDA